MIKKDIKIKCINLLGHDLGFNPRLIMEDFSVKGHPYRELFRYLPTNITFNSKEWKDWYYLEDNNNLLGILYNDRTNEYRLTKRIEDPELKGWDEKVIAMYQKSDDEIEIERIEFKKKVEEIRSTEVFKEIAPLIKAYLALPVNECEKYKDAQGELHIIDSIEYFQRLLRDPPYYFDEDKVKEWASIFSSLF